MIFFLKLGTFLRLFRSSDFKDIRLNILRIPFYSFKITAIFRIHNKPQYFRGQGVPRVQIIENEFEYLADTGNHGAGGHFVEKMLFIATTASRYIPDFFQSFRIRIL